MRDTLVGHSCGTVLWDTLLGHSCRPLSHKSYTLVRHSCRALLWDTLGCNCVTLVGHSLRKTLVGHSCRTLWWDTLVPPPSVTCQVSKTSASYETFSKTHSIQISKTSVSYETSSKTHSSAQVFKMSMKLPPKVTIQVSKTSVSRETPSKSHTSSHQKECCV